MISEQPVLAKRVTFIALLLLDLSVVLYLAGQVFTYRDYPFDADEANHALGALQMAQALENGDLGRFAGLFYAQDFYPPGFDWVKALSFLFFGATPTVARLVSVASLFLAILLIYALGLEFDTQWGWLAGFVAALLTLTIQPLLTNSALVMMEAPGLLVSFAWLYAYTRALKRPTAGHLSLASILLALAFLSKYTYGVVTTATMLIMELSSLWPFNGRSGEAPALDSRGRFVTLLRQRWIWLFGPFILAMFLWFLRLEKLAAFWGYTRPLSNSEPWFTAQNILFYPRSIILHQTLAPWFALVTAVSLLWTLTQLRRHEIRLVLLYFLLGMAAIMLVNHPVNPRFIVTFVPAAHLLTGAMITCIARRWQTTENPTTRSILAASAVLVALSFAFSIPLLVQRLRTIPSVMEAALETTPTTEQLYAWVTEQAPGAERLYVVNYWDQVNLPALRWYIGTHDDDAAQTAVYGRLLEPATPARTAALRQEIQHSSSTYLILLEGGPWGAPFWPEYTAEMQDILEPVARQRFTLEQYESDEWLDRSLLTHSAWEQAKQNGRSTLDVEAIVYKLIAEGPDG